MSVSKQKSSYSSSHWSLLVDGFWYLKVNTVTYGSNAPHYHVLGCMYVHTCRTDVTTYQHCVPYLVFSWKIRDSEWPENAHRWVEREITNRIDSSVIPLIPPRSQLHLPSKRTLGISAEQLSYIATSSLCAMLLCVADSKHCIVVLTVVLAGLDDLIWVVLKISQFRDNKNARIGWFWKLLQLLLVSFLLLCIIMFCLRTRI